LEAYDAVVSAAVATDRSLMNQLTLALNAAILAVTFVVALTAGSVQGDMLVSSTRGGGRVGARAVTEPSAATLLRVVQSMENFYPATVENTLNSTQLRTIQDAIDLYSSEIGAGIEGVLRESDDSRDVRAEIQQLGRTVRIDLESTLARAFGNPEVVRRLATEIIRHSS